MTTHSSILAWRIPWREEPGGLHSPWGHKELDMSERLTHINISFSHLDEKNNITSLKGFKERSHKTPSERRGKGTSSPGFQKGRYLRVL